MKAEVIVKEYVRNLSNSDLQYLNVRLQQRLGGDLEEACEMMAKDVEMDKLFSASTDSEDWFERVDIATKIVEKEVKRREY